VTDSSLNRIRARLAAEGLDALLVTTPSNVRYLSGFTAGQDATLLVSAKVALLITDFRYYEQFERQVSGCILVKQEKAFPLAFAEAVQQAQAKKIAFESSGITYARYQDLAATPGVELAPVKGWVEALRVIKTPSEITLMRHAVAIGDAVIAALPHLWHEGISEKQLAWAIQSFIHDRGAEDVSFPVIVAAGENGAMPHAVPSDRRIGRGEPVVLDLGARVEGYCSDLTRTVCFGHADARFLEIYNTVLAAQHKAESGIRAGVTGKEADALARQVITEAGYGTAFGHSLGHGVGLDIHEEPRASVQYEGKLEPGMTLTVEPGIYLPGWGGVRIEDLVVVTETGVEVLSAASKAPVVPC
jgi:Xaa-Pro aminopeptidase